MERFIVLTQIIAAFIAVVSISQLREALKLRSSVKSEDLHIEAISFMQSKPYKKNIISYTTLLVVSILIIVLLL